MFYLRWILRYWGSNVSESRLRPFWVMSGLSLGACMPNVKFVALVILELLAFNTPNFKGSRDPGHAPFYPLLTFGVGGRQGTSFELWTAIIGSETMPVKCFNTPIENTLHRCQFRGKLGKTRGYLIGYWPLTKGFFRIRFQMSVPNFIKIGWKLRPWERGQTDRQTDRHTEMTGVIL